MTGYTPLFSTLTTGTLCGRWPDIGLWPIVLSLTDRNGVVDCTQAYISGITGLPVDEVTACMARFCEPDPKSRSDTESGARLQLLDEHRDWGWRVVNHGLYREKARLAAKTAREIEEGRNKQRMLDRRSPPMTAADPPSKLQTQTTNKNLREEGAKALSPELEARIKAIVDSKRLPENMR